MDYTQVSREGLDRYYRLKVNSGHEISIKDMVWVIQLGYYTELTDTNYNRIMYTIKCIIEDIMFSKDVLSKEELTLHQLLKYDLSVPKKYDFYKYYIHQKVIEKSERYCTETKEWNILSMRMDLQEIRYWFEDKRGFFMEDDEEEAYDKLIQEYVRYVNTKLGDYGSKHRVTYEEIRKGL